MPNKSPFPLERIIDLYGDGSLNNVYSQTDCKYKYCDKCCKTVKGRKKTFMYGKIYAIKTHSVCMIEYECKHLKPDIYVKYPDLCCYEEL